MWQHIQYNSDGTIYLNGIQVLSITLESILEIKLIDNNLWIKTKE